MEFAFLIPIMGIIMGVSIPITALKHRHREKIEQMRLAASGNPLPMDMFEHVQMVA